MSGTRGFVYENWAGTVSCRPAMYFEPANLNELRTIIADATRKQKKVKVIGYGHSPSDINCTNDFMVCLKHFNKTLEVDSKAKTVKVEAGILLKELNPLLDKHGLALENLPAIDHASIGGLLATGSHNSGIAYGIIATQVLEFELLKADGTMEVFSKNNNVDLFNLTVVGLGALGVVTSVALQCVPAFNLCQTEEPSTLEESMENLEENIANSDYFKLLYLPHVDRCINVHIKKTNKKPRRVQSSWFWDVLIGFHFYQLVLYFGTFIPIMIPFINRIYNYFYLSATKEECDKSFKILHFNCMFKQRVMEWCVPRKRLPELLMGLREFIRKNTLKVHLPVEIRFGKADTIGLSPCYERETAFMNALMFRPYGCDQRDVAEYFAGYKQLAMKMHGRPHWAKNHGASPEYLQTVYPRMGDFLAVVKRLDPTAMFENEYVRRHIGRT